MGIIRKARTSIRCVISMISFIQSSYTSSRLSVCCCGNSPWVFWPSAFSHQVKRQIHFGAQTCQCGRWSKSSNSATSLTASPPHQYILWLLVGLVAAFRKVIFKTRLLFWFLMPRTRENHDLHSCNY